VVLYLAAVFTYQIGFLLPIVMVLLLKRGDRPQAKSIASFGAVAAAYLWFRYLGPGTSHVTGGFVDHHMRLSSRRSSMCCIGSLTLPGPYRGLWALQFLHIDKGWLAILVLLDLVLLIVVRGVVRTVARDCQGCCLPHQSRVSDVPCFSPADSAWGEGVAGRHLILPMLAIIIVVAIRFPRLGMAARQTWATLLLVILLLLRKEQRGCRWCLQNHGIALFHSDREVTRIKDQ